MGRPPSDLDDYLDWQERLENYKASGLEVDVFCLQEGFSRTTFYRWVDLLKNGIPESMLVEKAARQRAESGEAAFVPISQSLSRGNRVAKRLPLGVGQVVLVEVIRAVGALRPTKRKLPPLVKSHVNKLRSILAGVVEAGSSISPVFRTIGTNGISLPKTRSAVVADGRKTGLAKT